MVRLKATIGFIALSLLVCPASLAGTSEREEMLEKGLRNNVPYSYALSINADETDSTTQKRTIIEEAIALSPDTPGLYFKLAWARLPDFAGGLDSLIGGLRAYGRNFWWSVNLWGLAYISLTVSLVLAMAVAALIRFPLELPLLMHDINENKAKVLLPLLAALMATLGPAALVVGVLFLTGFYFRKDNRHLFYLAVLLMLFSPLFIRHANLYFSAPSPELRAMAAVNEGRDNAYALDVLTDSPGVAPRFSYATALKREGRPLEAIDVFTGILGDKTGSKTYTNLGNAYVAAGHYEYAIQSYKKALEPARSVIPLYNLSQVYRHEFDYTAGDKYYGEAIAEDRELVSYFTGITGKNPNRMVIDETLGRGELWKQAGLYRRGVVNIYAASPYLASLAAAFLLFLFFVADRRMKNRAFRCLRCGRITCEKCNGGRKIRGQICLECFTARTSPDDDSPKLRVAKMLSASEQRNRSRAIVKALSFAPPGIAQIYSGRALSGLLYLWMFLFAITMLVLNPLFTAGMAHFSHGWLWLPLAPFIIAVYAVSLISINRRVDRGWL